MGQVTVVGDLLLQTGLKGWTEECTIPNWAVSASFSVAGEKQSAGLCITCVERLIVPLGIFTPCFMESIKRGCCCMDENGPCAQQSAAVIQAGEHCLGHISELCAPAALSFHC